MREIAGSRVAGRAVAYILLALTTGSCPMSRAPSAARPGVARTADQLFSLAFVPALDLAIGAEARRALDDDPDRHVAATLTHGGRRYPVRVKLKGNRTFRRLDDKAAFRLVFDGDGFLGLHHLALDNLVDDPTGVHEILAYRLFRAAGVPAPRAAYARVSVDGVPYGTYLMVEPVDGDLVTDRLGGPPEALFEGEYGCDLWTDDAPRIERKLGDDGARDRFAALAGLADRDPARLFDPAGSPLDVAEVVSFLAVDAVIGDFDGYWHSHNYFLAEGPPAGRWRILPWGVDRVFRDHLPVDASQGRLARLCTADPGCRLAYARRLGEVAGLAERVLDRAEVDRLLGLAAAVLDDAPRSVHRPAERRAARAELRDFAARRPGEIRGALGCLDGDREVDRDGDGYGCMDCDDTRADVHPGAAETCDRVDDDCDGLVDDAPACPCQVVRAGGAELHLCDLPMSWAEARGFCAARGMSLARIDSAAQARAVYDAAVALRDDRWWLGGRQADDGTLTWADGSAASFTYWNQDEPRNRRCQQRCLVLDDGGDGTWALGHCQLAFPFICRAPQ